ncbi:MAG: 30S ribosomal protein S8 [Candidatus Aenigmarchaeota archaeon]|nr:30S ribosomal protein S8 [Candidatus Aenigmarchaeota archaeon]
MKHDPLADTFATIKNAESIGKKHCQVQATGLVKGVLKVIEENRFIEGFELVNDGKGGKFKVRLKGEINDCNVIRPRFSITKGDMIKWEKKYLPSQRLGILIMTTPKGIVSQKEAVRLNTGGKLLGFVY